MKQPEADTEEAQVQRNLTKWQSSSDPFAPLEEDQVDLVYEIGDRLKELYSQPKGDLEGPQQSDPLKEAVPFIRNNREFVKWMIQVEKTIKHENLWQFEDYRNSLTEQSRKFENLYNLSSTTLENFDQLKNQYDNIVVKTNYLHGLSEQLMLQQKLLKDKKNALHEKLKYFTMFNRTQEKIDQLNVNVNSQEYINNLRDINECIAYLSEHLQYKESRVYKMKYESLLETALNKIYKYVSTVITETTSQVFDLKTPSENPNLNDNSFALYYGKFQSASIKIKLVLGYLEEMGEDDHYSSIVNDCKKIYFALRFPVLDTALSKALSELKEKYKTDHSMLFRSCCLFLNKVCQDEAQCYNYFFNDLSSQFNDYLGSLCQHLYDTLRPHLITINHIEILCELCGILKNEMLTDSVLENQKLLKFTETIKQLLQDIEERLVFRANIYFLHELGGYQPSPGDLAYPEKLIQLKDIAVELKQSSTELFHNSEPSVQHFRSYTGSSPADLHGMWYPTVKRTLVCLSRLYFCLDRDTFQGLAQEALIICIGTIRKSSDLISSQKQQTDGKLFQIKHLLIIREQIAPFQVDFTVRELSLDFSSMQKATAGLIQNRRNIFSFSSNNALLEFLLEGTPKVKEYLIDSRKEIDRELKKSCEDFIAYATRVLIGGLQTFMQQVEVFHKAKEVNKEAKLYEQDFAKAEVLAEIVKEVQRNMKAKIPEVQSSLRLYLANPETEMILFKPIKNNMLAAFIAFEQVLTKEGYSTDDQLLISCPSPEQVNILICSVSLGAE